MFLVLRIDETFSIRISIKRYKYKICEKSINRKIKNAETSLISTFSTIFLIGWAGKIRILQEYFLASLTAPAHPSDAFLLTFHFIPNKKVVTFVTTFSFGWAGKIRTCACQSQSLVPYRLATAQYNLIVHFVRQLFQYSPNIKSGVSTGIRTQGLQCHKLAR